MTPLSWTPRKIFRRILLVLLLVVIVLNWTWGRIPKQPPVPYGKFADVGDARIHYVEKPGADPPVVMVHGLPGTWGDWNEVAAALPGRHTIAIDRPGFAYSSDNYLAFDDQVKAIHALTRKLRLKNPVIAGHSYGGTLALGYALAYPRETRGIVLVDAADDPDGGSKLELAQAYAIKFLQLPVIKTIADLTFSQLLRTVSADAGGKQAFDPNPVDEQFHKRLLDLNMQSEDVKSWSEEIIAFGGVIDDLDPRVPSIDTPAFIVQGRDDQLVSLSSAKRLHRRLPGSKMVVVQGGHMAPYDHPDVVAQQIKLALR